MITIPREIDSIIPKKDGYRRVALQKYTDGVFCQYGYFHGWHSKHCERGRSSGVETVAIIEYQDGKVFPYDIFSNQFQFIDQL